jgi:hypothetical protein
MDKAIASGDKGFRSLSFTKTIDNNTILSNPMGQGNRILFVTKNTDKKREI